MISQASFTPWEPRSPNLDLEIALLPSTSWARPEAALPNMLLRGITQPFTFPKPLLLKVSIVFSAFSYFSGYVTPRWATLAGFSVLEKWS